MTIRLSAMQAIRLASLLATYGYARDVEPSEAVVSLRFSPGPPGSFFDLAFVAPAGEPERGVWVLPDGTVGAAS